MTEITKNIGSAVCLWGPVENKRWSLLLLLTTANLSRERGFARHIVGMSKLSLIFNVREFCNVKSFRMKLFEATYETDLLSIFSARSLESLLRQIFSVPISSQFLKILLFVLSCSFYLLLVGEGKFLIFWSWFRQFTLLSVGTYWGKCTKSLEFLTTQHSYCCVPYISSSLLVVKFPFWLSTPKDYVLSVWFMEINVLNSRTSTVECWSILSIDSLDLQLNRYSIDIPVNVPSTLDQQSEESWLSVDWLTCINNKLVES